MPYFRPKIQQINGKRKAESEKLLIFFRFSLGVKNGSDAKPRAEGACTLCRGAKEQKPAQAGLKRKTFLKTF